MLSKQLIQLIDASLRRPNPPAERLRLIEGAGSEAFDHVVRRMSDGSLSEHHRVHALRRLALITRHGCPDRRGEVMDIAIAMSTDESIVARSGAVAMVIGLCLFFEQYTYRGRTGEKYPNTPKGALRLRMRKVVAEALRLGVDEETEAFAARFMKADR